MSAVVNNSCRVQQPFGPPPAIDANLYNLLAQDSIGVLDLQSLSLFHQLYQSLEEVKRSLPPLEQRVSKEGTYDQRVKTYQIRLAFQSNIKTYNEMLSAFVVEIGRFCLTYY